MIQGSGVTALGRGVVRGAASAELRELQIKSTAADERTVIEVTSGSTEGRGMAFLDTSAPAEVRDVQIRVSGASNNTGMILLYFGGTTLIEHSEVAGASYTVLNQLSTGALIGASRLQGGPAFGGATCAGVYDESFTFFAGPACP